MATFQIPRNTGFIQDKFDPRDAWEDEVLRGEGETVLPSHYRVDSFKFEGQGAWPFCVSFAVTALAEQRFRARKANFEFSQPHLFFHSGGNQTGSSFRPNLDIAVKNGCIGASIMPMPGNIWDWDDASFAREKNKAIATPFTGAQKVPGYVRISPTTEALKSAIIRYGGLLVGVNAHTGIYRDYWVDKTVRHSTTDTHAVVLAGWDDDGSWWIFDSLQPRTNFDGYHRLNRDYGFNSAYAITELPADWKDLRDEARTEPYAHCLNHYGKPRDFETETKNAALLLEAFKKFNNQSVLEAAGKFWTVLVNMTTYGGYSINYYRFGILQPGDAINLVYAWRRTGQLIFDPNKERKEYV